MELLGSFYWELAGVFRYKAGSNQLEFIFSGRSHYDKYLDDWTEAFEMWIEDFVCSPYFIRAMLEMTIISPDSRAAWLAKDRLKGVFIPIFQFEGVQIPGDNPHTSGLETNF